MERLKHSDLITFFSQITGAGEPRRSGTYDSNFVTVGLWFDLGFPIGMSIVPIRNKSFKSAYAYRFALNAADTFTLALILLGAHSAADSRE